MFMHFVLPLFLVGFAFRFGAQVATDFPTSVRLDAAGALCWTVAALGLGAALVVAVLS